MAIPVMLINIQKTFAFLKMQKISYDVIYVLYFCQLSCWKDDRAFFLFSFWLFRWVCHLLQSLIFLQTDVNWLKPHRASCVPAAGEMGRDLQLLLIQQQHRGCIDEGSRSYLCSCDIFQYRLFVIFTLYLQTKPASRALAVMTFLVALHQKDITELCC